MKKEVVEQFMAVLLPEYRSQLLFVVRHECTDILYQRQRLRSRDFNSTEHKKYPGFPLWKIVCPFVANILYETIILSLMVSNITT